MLLALLIGCFTDQNERHCTYFSAVSDGEDTWCINPDAPEECDQVVDAIIDAFEICLGSRFDEEEARIAADEAVDCDAAVATTDKLDRCIEQLEDPECSAGGPQIPNACNGAVLVEGP